MKAYIHDPIYDLTLKNYDEYQKFIGYKLPKFKYRYLKTDSGTVASTKHPNEENKQHILQLDTVVTDVHPDYFKRTLYHEFTHIWDFERLVTNPSLYTEINATIISLMCSYGFTSLSDNRKVDHSIKTHFINDEINFEMELKRFEKEIENGKQKFLSSINIDSTLPIYDRYIAYYLGYLKFAKLYYDGNIDFDMLNNMSDFISIDLTDIINAIPNSFILSEESLCLFSKYDNLIFDTLAEMKKNMLITAKYGGI